MALAAQSRRQRHPVAIHYLEVDGLLRSLVRQHHDGNFEQPIDAPATAYFSRFSLISPRSIVFPAETTTFSAIVSNRMALPSSVR